MPQGRQCVRAGERGQRIGEIAMHVFRRMENGLVRADTEVDLKQAEVERAAVPEEGDNKNAWV